jgi:hypothetical protein
MKKDTIINDLFSKSSNLNYEIYEKINDVRKGGNIFSALDKIKEKIYEKIENLHESLKMLEREINDSTLATDKSLIWKKYSKKSLKLIFNSEKFFLLIKLSLTLFDKKL